MEEVRDEIVVVVGVVDDPPVPCCCCCCCARICARSWGARLGATAWRCWANCVTISAERRDCAALIEELPDNDDEEDEAGAADAERDDVDDDEDTGDAIEAEDVVV